MQTVTLTSKFQIRVPKAIRERLGLKAGQQFILVTEGGTLNLIPRRNIEGLRGLLRGASTADIRDRR